MRDLEIIIKGEAKEIAALVSAIQERRAGTDVPVDVIKGAVQKAIGDMSEGKSG